MNRRIVFVFAFLVFFLASAFSPHPGHCFWVTVDLPQGKTQAVFKVLEIRENGEKTYWGYLWYRPDFDPQGRTKGSLADSYIIIQKNADLVVYRLGWYDETANDEMLQGVLSLTDDRGLKLNLLGVGTGMCIPGLLGGAVE
jgi:hypothetical protein